MNYGEKIAALRKKNDMTQAQLGDALNVTYQAVSKWERDETHPDFETMSKIAKLFRVPLSYFEEDNEPSSDSENARAQQPAEAAAPARELIGVCTVCGKAMYEGDNADDDSKLICDACAQKQKQAILAAQKAEQERNAREEEEKRKKLAAENYSRKRKRNRGLIWSAVITGALLIACVVPLCITQTDVLFSVGGTVCLALFTYTFVSQLFWGGAVRTVCLAGGWIADMPGVIFTLDLDGIIFLIVAKILFAFLKLLFFVFNALVCAIGAMLISPFTFIPALVRTGKTIKQ